MKNPKEIVNEMMQKDAFSNYLGIEIQEIKEGSCQLKLLVNAQMLNGFTIAHGGITYSLADSALAFASNSYGHKAVSIETSISHLKKVVERDVLIAKCSEIHRGKTIGKYKTEVFKLNQDGGEVLVAHFYGTVHISKEIW